MLALAAYGGSSSDSDDASASSAAASSSSAGGAAAAAKPPPPPGAVAPLLRPARAIVAAPRVNMARAVVPYAANAQLALKQRANLPAAQMNAPLQGPEHPFRKGLNGGGLGTGAGAVEEAAVDGFSFTEQFHTFDQFGYGRGVGVGAGAGGSAALVGDAGAAAARSGETVFSVGGGGAAREEGRKRKREQRKAERDVANDDGSGIWATHTDHELGDGDAAANAADAEQAEALAVRRAAAAAAKGEAAEQRAANFDEDADFDRMVERKVGHLLPPRLETGHVQMAARSSFHGEAETDYQGRSWAHPPSELKPTDGSQDAFIPKRCIHKWAGHKKGVNAIAFFPRYGHLLLSASLDATVKIWDVLGDRRCMRTYHGHSLGVKGIDFSSDGSRFLSCSFDRHVRMWDTETGACLGTYTNRKVPNCAKFYPRDENVFLCAMSDNKVVQYDSRSGELVQTYDHHLAAVNTVTFVDEGRRFVSTSDDKKALVWEYDTPVPIKYISEPDMHSMPAVNTHPSGEFWVGQSLDNKIVTYGATGRMKLFRKKVYKGHTVTGYACMPGFSPNGKFLMSGDGQGQLVFWDFKSTKLYRKLHAHSNGPCMQALWHPIEPSRVATCGWDGLIKYWD